jgi:group I intron endonuclease
MVNGKVYIGSTKQTLQQRRNEHISCLRRGKHSSALLQEEFNSFGEEGFAFDILATAENAEDLLKLEMKFTNEYNAMRRATGYNMRCGLGKFKGDVARKLGHKKIGKHGFKGAYLTDKNKPENKVWRVQTRYNKYIKTLGYFIDPLTCEILFNLVKEEINAELYG